LRSFWPNRNTSERTEVRVLHSSIRLFVLFVCEDVEIVATRTARDDHTFRDDCVEVFLAAPLPGPLSEGLNIEVSATGAWADVLYRKPNWLNYDWNPPGLNAVVKRTLTGWTVELALPFADIAAVAAVHGYADLLDASRMDFRNTAESLARPLRLRANFARWHRPENVLTVWSDPRRPTPHALELDRYGWLVFDR